MLVPGPPSAVALKHAVGGLGVESGVEKLFCGGDANIGQPVFMPSVVDLKEAVAAVVGDADGIGVELAFAAGDLEGAFFEFVGPFVADDLDDLGLGVFHPLGCGGCLGLFLGSGLGDTDVVADQNLGGGGGFVKGEDTFEWESMALGN